MSKRNKLIILLRKSPILKIIPVLLRLVAKSCGEFSIYLFINKYVAIVTKVAVIFAHEKTDLSFFRLNRAKRKQPPVSRQMIAKE